MHAFTFLKLYTETIGQASNLLSQLNLLIQPKKQNTDGQHNELYKCASSFKPHK